MISTKGRYALRVMIDLAQQKRINSYHWMKLQQDREFLKNILKLF